jgi:hypothetical protein
MIEPYVIGLLITNSILILWFYSPLTSSISHYFFHKKEIYTFNSFIDFLVIKNAFLGKLLSCWICLSFWLSFIVGMLFTIIFNLPIWYPLLTYFTYPAILFLIKQLYR